MNTQLRPQPSARVLLFCPVRVDRDIFELVEKSHRSAGIHAQLNGIRIERLYFDDNDSKYVGDIVPAECVLSLEGLSENATGYEEHNWSATGTSRIADIRNAAIMQTINGDYTHLFLVDADLVLQTNTITELVKTDLTVVSEVFWSKWQIQDPWLPNVWEKNPYRFETSQSILNLREPGLYRVGGLGACTLINADMLRSIRSVNYTNVPGYDMWGEDRHFAMRCAVAGVPLTASTYNPPFHVYRREMLDEATKWFHQDGGTAFFQDNWLTLEWAKLVRDVFDGQLPNGGGAKPPCIVLCLPGEDFSTAWVNHYTNVYTHLLKRGFSVMPLFGESSDAAATRGDMWRSIVSGEATDGVRVDYVLWLDDDNLLTGQQFEQLLCTLEANPGAGMVAGWCWCDRNGIKQGNELTPSFGAFAENQSTIPVSQQDALQPGFAEYDWTGFPVVLMRWALLEALKEVAWPFARIPSPRFRFGSMGEDVSFCHRVHMHTSYKILVDRSVKVHHLKRHAVDLIPEPDQTGAVTTPVAVQSA